MTDKEQATFKIDGVNVMQCENFYRACMNTKKPEAICHKYKFCSENPNCYYKQLARKTQEYDNLSDLLRATDIYTRVCMSCADEILIYPSISGRTSYTDNEVDVITLKRIINTLRNKTQECEELKEENQRLEMQLCNDCGERDDYNIPCKMIRDLNYGLQKEIEENDRYRKALEEIEKVINNILNSCLGRNTAGCRPAHNVCGDLIKILDIINKAKGEEE